MATAADARRIAASLPGVSDDSTDQSLAFTVGGKGFAWSWKERAHPRKPRVAKLGVLALRCIPEAKDIMLEAEPDKFFTEPHYDGYPAVLLRLEAVDDAELRAILISAWRCMAPPPLLAEFKPG